MPTACNWPPLEGAAAEPCAPARSAAQAGPGHGQDQILPAEKSSLSGDSAVLLELAGTSRTWSMDWEYGTVALARPGGQPSCSPATCAGRADLGRRAPAACAQTWPTTWPRKRAACRQREAQARFDELDDLKLALDRLDARIDRLARSLARLHDPARHPPPAAHPARGASATAWTTCC